MAPHDHDPHDAPLTWRRRQVERVTGLGTTSLYKLVAQGRFPRGRRVPGCPGLVVWLADEVRAWLEALPPADPHDRPARGRRAAGTSPGAQP